MMHPDFFSFLEKRGKHRLTVSTNGHFLSPESAVRIVRSGLGKLTVSLDGMDQDTYSAYRRNGDFGKVINGIRNTALAKRRYMSDLKIEIQFLVNKRMSIRYLT
jgi:MoaA/NifB/PqqE/SkfB family radical SAM enzyme